MKLTTIACMKCFDTADLVSYYRHQGENDVFILFVCSVTKLLVDECSMFMKPLGGIGLLRRNS